MGSTLGARVWIRPSILALACGVAGCGDLVVPGIEDRGGAAGAVVGGAVVSTVDGQPIEVDEVASLVAASGLDRGEALRRLQADRLLRAEAARRRIAPDAETRVVARQALVQALLDEETATVGVSEAELRAAYEAKKGRFVQPERRGSLHVLAFVREGASEEHDRKARAFASEVVQTLSRAPDVEAAWKAYQGVKDEGLEVAAERIPEIDRDAPFAEPYLDALFSVDVVSIVPQPVRTTFGWHAIAVTTIVPRVDTSFEEAAATLRSELLVEKRKAHVDELVARLRREARVSLAVDVAAQLAEVPE